VSTTKQVEASAGLRKVITRSSSPEGSRQYASRPCSDRAGLPGANDTSHVEPKNSRIILLTSVGRSR
jgi:hypothetical protein